MGLEIATNKEPGTVIRTTPASRPQLMGLLIVFLTIIEFVFVALVLNVTLFPGTVEPLSAHQMDPEVLAAPGAGLLISEQQIVSMWLAGSFFTLAQITFLYQRYFVDHVTIAKKRFRKWEDEGVQFS
jgi:hypothetical protein